MIKKQPLTYKDAGVDIDAGNTLVNRIKATAKDTLRPEILSGLGGFGAACEIPSHYKQPVLISGTDGVGSKLKLAIQLNQHDTIGVDLVAMCANDILVSGAEPLFFLDYFATGHLNVDIAETIIKGIGLGCKQAGCALAGGETAEMPGMYQGSDYDLAGFCLGVVEKNNIINGSQVQPGDTVIGLRSSGAHANGYSLIRKILQLNQVSLDAIIDGQTLGDRLIEPTRIYVKPILQLLKYFSVHSISHITGGGLLENVPRTLPEGTEAVLDTKSWPMNPLFKWIQSEGNISSHEMYRTFNCGVGMTLVLPAAQANDAINLLSELGESPWIVGRIKESHDAACPITLAGL